MAISSSQWVAVVNQDLPIGTVRQWGAIQVCPALPNLFGDRPVQDSKLCYNLVESVYGQPGIGTNGRIRLYIVKYTMKATIPISVYRFS